MELKSGAILQVESDKLEKRIFFKLIGIREGKYLIISSPKITNKNHLKSDVDSNFPLNSKLILRSLSGGTIYGFESTVIKVIHEPDVLIFIEYPNEIEIYNLRKEKRVKINIPAKVIISKKSYSVTMINLSNNGCLINIDSNNQDIQDMLSTAKLIFIKFTDPNSSTKYEIDCKVQNKNMANGILEVDFSFDEMDINLRTKINQLISHI
jgi:hypothetical protein